MKRYKKLPTTIQALDGSVVDVDNAMAESATGEWVKYEDVEAVERLGFGKVHCGSCGADMSKGNHRPKCWILKPEFLVTPKAKLIDMVTAAAEEFNAATGADIKTIHVHSIHDLATGKRDPASIHIDLEVT